MVVMQKFCGPFKTVNTNILKIVIVVITVKLVLNGIWA
jgi:hypothetical protein